MEELGTGVMVLDAMTRATEVDVITIDTTEVVEITELEVGSKDAASVVTEMLTGEEVGGVLTGCVGDDSIVLLV